MNDQEALATVLAFPVGVSYIRSVLQATSLPSPHGVGDLGPPHSHG